MKKASRILVYDDNCPLCNWYTSLFVRYHLLEADERKAFSSLDKELLDKIGFEKSRNEIPLLDPITGKVKYGIDALLDILGGRYPVIRRIGYFPGVNWFLRKLYKLISYNRKVIVAKKCNSGAIDCAPDLNYRYRYLFLFLGLLFNSLMLLPVYDHILKEIPGFTLSLMEVQFAHFGLVGINVMLSFSFNKEKRIEYLGQVNMLALICILLQLPLIGVLQIIKLPFLSIEIYLGIATLIIIREYLFRMTYAGILPRNLWVAALNLCGMFGYILVMFN